MKPVIVLRYSASEGPGYFSTHLARRGIPCEVVRIDRADPLPLDVAACSGLVMMGGPMSANDALPWIPVVLGLVRQAVEADVPVLGHCLGAQLMAKAMGAEVKRNAVKEIGWGEVTVEPTPVARQWFGCTHRFLAFHWHGETFDVPHGWARLAGSEHCANQAFSYGKHLGLQCHIEMTAAMVQAWCRSGAEELQEAAGPSVQSPEEIERDLAERLEALHGIADAVYDRWIQSLEGFPAGDVSRETPPRAALNP